MKNPYSTKKYKYDVNNADEHHLQQFDDRELENLDTEEHLQVFYHLLEEACEKCLPRKKEFLEREDTDEKEDVHKKSKNYIPNVRMLMKKKQKLSQKIMKSKSWEKNYSGMLELQELKKNYRVSTMQEEERRKMKPSKS